ncbi:hypothetical protein ASPSYDRAFT_164401 [Aspergillus sydowii CBS 593.65]|uniref:Uncharacterized protein n=1 Tax=Aspergillus sydowii CBS 593.65 TaxID=1036612 RepID=A0A1L9SZN2_9EURO|nr:uncharacterized protein ASPSYDRAFT_164401 [Aspergillus sydowii CBS 593.65]OJJ52628.1 hypothetical protein ASPSYDRAFT_164401 [Aspergillus sydowii CBS 593.65]
MKFSVILPFFPLLAVASPTCKPSSSGDTLTAAQIETVAPKSSSCANPDKVAPEECATAAQAAPALTTAFKKYGVTSKAEQAAVLGLIAFESGEFRFSRNHFPGVEGQGTRNMQSPDFNKKYAASIDALKEKFEEVKDQPGKVLDLLLEDPAVDFGSGAWFLTTQCDDSVREKLQSGNEEGWKGYIVDCVGTEANSERKGYWTAAVKALGA